MTEAASIIGMQPQRKPQSVRSLGWILLAGLAAFAHAGEGQEPATNMAMVRSLVGQLAAQVIAEIDAPEVVLHRLPPLHPAGWLLEQELLRVAQERQVTTYLAADTALGHDAARQGSAVNVGFRMLAAGVHYAWAGAGLFCSGLLRRTVFCHANVVATTGEGRVLWSRDFHNEAADTVSLRALRFLEDAGVTFTQGQVPPARGAARLLEPTLVLIVSGLVTYLFYAYRSK